MSDGADWTSTGRLFQSRGSAAANERSPTVKSRDGRTLTRLEVDKRTADRQRTEARPIGTEVQCHEELEDVS